MNYNSILVRYSEIHLKGKNRGYFEKVLKTNINEKIKKFGTTLESTSGRYIIRGFNEEDINDISKYLLKTAGIYSISPAVEVDASKEAIYETALSLMQDKEGTFRVSSTRADKKFPLSSMELSRDLGGVILSKNRNLLVDLHTPQYNLSVDIRNNGKAYIFFEEYRGVNGMPVSSSGKGMLLLSGGIDI